MILGKATFVNLLDNTTKYEWKAFDLRDDYEIWYHLKMSEIEEGQCTDGKYHTMTSNVEEIDLGLLLDQPVEKLAGLHIRDLVILIKQYSLYNLKNINS